MKEDDIAIGALPPLSSQIAINRSHTLKRKLHRWWNAQNGAKVAAPNATDLSITAVSRPSTSLTLRSDDSNAFSDDSHMSIHSTSSTLHSRVSESTATERLKHLYPGLRDQHSRTLLHWIGKADKNWSAKMQFLNFELVKQAHTSKLWRL